MRGLLWSFLALLLSPALLIGGVIFALCMLVLSVFWSTTATMTVTEQSWTRTIQLEERRAVQGETWCDQRPASAQPISRERRVRSTRSKTPVEADWCVFTVDSWVRIQEAVASSEAEGPIPRWPEVPEAVVCAEEQHLGCQRIVQKETYTLTLQEEDEDGEEGETHPCEVTEALWREVVLGESLQITQNVPMGFVTCSSLRQPEAVP